MDGIPSVSIYWKVEGNITDTGVSRIFRSTSLFMNNVTMIECIILDTRESGIMHSIIAVVHDRAINGTCFLCGKAP